jgi:hypothetical protein
MININDNSPVQKEEEKSWTRTIQQHKLFKYFNPILVLCISFLLIYYSTILKYTLSFICGIVFTLVVQSIILLYIVGAKIDKTHHEEVVNTVNQGKIENGADPENEGNVPEEEDLNDIKISYITIAKKNPYDNSKLKIPQIKSTKEQIDNRDMNNIHRDISNTILIDQNFYCQCKFSPSNFEKIVKFRTNLISSHANIIINIISDSISMLRSLSASSKKLISSMTIISLKEDNSSPYSQISNTPNNNINVTNYYLTEESFNYQKKYKHFLSYFSKLQSKIIETSDIIYNVIINNLKIISQQSCNDYKELYLQLNKMIKEVNDKEYNLHVISDKYINQKKTIDKLMTQLEYSRTKVEKYETVVKIEMDLKIGNKILTEIQQQLEKNADDYKELRQIFSRKSLHIYLQFLKIFNRENEAIKGLLLSFYENFQDLIDIMHIQLITEDHYDNQLSEDEGREEIFDEQSLISYKIKYKSSENFVDLNDIIEKSLVNEQIMALIAIKLNQALENTKNNFENRNFNMNRMMFILNKMKLLSNELGGKFYSELMLLSKKFNTKDSMQSFSILNKFISNMNFQESINNNCAGKNKASFTSILGEFLISNKTIINLFNESTAFINQEMILKEKKIQELIMIIKEESFLIIRKIEQLITKFKNECKFISKEKDQNKRETQVQSLLNEIQKDITIIVEYLNKLELIQNEIFSIQYTSFNIYNSAVLSSNEEILKQSKLLNERLIKITDVHVKNKEKLFNKFDLNANFDFEKFKEEVNNEITAFLLTNCNNETNILTLTHENKCNLYSDNDNIIQTPSILSNNLNKKAPGYFFKFKDFVLRKFNKAKDTSKKSLYQTLDKIIQYKANEEEEKTYESYQIDNRVNIYKKKEEATWLNQLLTTFFSVWKDGEIFKKSLKKYLYRIYNKKRPENLDTIYIDDVKLSGAPPFIRTFKEVDFQKKSEYEVNYFLKLKFI